MTRRKSIAILLVLSLIIGLFTIGASASNIEESSKITYSKWEANLFESNTIMDAFFTYYENEACDDILLPEYYAGFQVLDDATLKMYITDDSDEIIDNIEYICNTNNISYEKVEYSYNCLEEAMISLAQSNSDDILYATIAIPDNTVNLYVEDASSSKLADLEKETEDFFNVFAYESEYDVYLTTTHSDGSIYAQPEDESTIRSSEIVSNAVAATTTLKYGALGYAGTNGTVGYLALDGSGNRILVTHGHDLTKGTTYKYGGSSGTSVGSVTKILGTSNTLDAAIITLTTNTVITNKANWNSSASFTSAVSYSSSLSSVVGNTGYFRGMTTGSEKSATIQSAYDSSAGVYLYYLVGLTSLGGDSGAPIYTKTSTTAFKLIGIVKGYDSGGVKIIPVFRIKDAYEHYVYLNSTSY